MSLFTDKAPKIMGDLMKDFALDMTAAAAILGNLGHETGGFKFLQEIKPTVPGSKGGYGIAQWTGPRRRSYEAYCQRNKLDPASDKANYAYLFVELSGLYKEAIAAVKRADGLRAKVVAFEMSFERAGVKAYDSRVAWAEKALVAYRDSVKDGQIVPPIVLPYPPDPPVSAEPKPPPPDIPATVPPVIPDDPLPPDTPTEPSEPQSAAVDPFVRTLILVGLAIAAVGYGAWRLFGG